MKINLQEKFHSKTLDVTKLSFLASSGDGKCLELCVVIYAYLEVEKEKKIL